MRNGWTLAAACVAAFAATLSGALVSAAVPDVLIRPALSTRLLDRVALSAVTVAGKRLVAVGERGVVIFSDDEGKHWQQAKVPVSVTLTAVQFVTQNVGWAVGNSGVVLRSDDGGASWTRQLDGKTAAALVLAAAQRDSAAAGASAAVVDRQVAEARQMVADGPDKPFLDVRFDDLQHGLVVGAYGLAFHTDDGGAHWTPWLSHIDNKGGRNLYSVATSRSHRFIVGEQGLVLHSEDGGQSFVSLNTPGKASYFAVASVPGKSSASTSVVIAGLGGEAYRSTDDGQTWKAIKVSDGGSVLSLIALKGGRLAAVDQRGQILMSLDGGQTFRPYSTKAARPITAFVELDDGKVIGVGLAGYQSRGIDAEFRKDAELNGAGK